MTYSLVIQAKYLSRLDLPHTQTFFRQHGYTPTPFESHEVWRTEVSANFRLPENEICCLTKRIEID